MQSCAAIGGLHSHCSIGVDPFAFLRLKAKKQTPKKSHCEQNPDRREFFVTPPDPEQSERRGETGWPPCSPLTVSGFQSEAAGRLLCVRRCWARSQGATSRASGALVIVTLWTDSAQSSWKSIRSFALGFWGKLCGIREQFAWPHVEMIFIYRAAIGEIEQTRK